MSGPKGRNSLAQANGLGLQVITVSCGLKGRDNARPVSRTFSAGIMPDSLPSPLGRAEGTRPVGPPNDNNPIILMSTPKKKASTSHRLRFLVTAGPTIEDIDPVRFISNRSTGKLGIAIVAAAIRLGHRATLVHGPVAESILDTLPRSSRLRTVPVRSTREMYLAVMKQARNVDVVIMNAAVADYTPVKVASIKLKKNGKRQLSLRLSPTIDILYRLGRLKKKLKIRVLIGFALETGMGQTGRQQRKSREMEALRKLKDKNLDAIVLNTPMAMGAEKSDFTVFLAGAGRREDYSSMSKADFARVVVKLARSVHACAMAGRGGFGTKVQDARLYNAWVKTQGLHNCKLGGGRPARL